MKKENELIDNLHLRRVLSCSFKYLDAFPLKDPKVRPSVVIYWVKLVPILSSSEFKSRLTNSGFYFRQMNFWSIP